MLLPLAACSAHIGEVTDSASATDSGVSVSSTGQPTTTGAQSTGTEAGISGPGGTGSTGPASTGTDTGAATESSVGSTDASVGTDESGSSAGTGVVLDMGMEDIWNAKVEHACTPDDWPAVGFYFGPTEPVCGKPWPDLKLNVVLYQGWPLAPGNYSIAGGKGSAGLSLDGQPPEWSVMGTVDIDSWEGDTIIGSYSLQFADFVLDGEFTAPFCPEAGGFCG